MAGFGELAWEPPGGYPAEYGPALQAQARHAAALAALPDVVGIGVGEKVTGGRPAGTPALVVYVDVKADREDGLVPPSVDGVPTDVVACGRPDAPPVPPATTAPDPLGLRRRHRPVHAGLSAGNTNASGTIGAVCRDAGPDAGRRYLLSANHVFAISNLVDAPAAILQPARADGGTKPDAVVATVSRSVPLRLGPGSRERPNVVDAAIAEARPADVDWAVPGTGPVTGIDGVPRIGLRVAKTGRTTGRTEGRVAAVNALVLVRVRANAEHPASWFTGQMIVAIKVAAGDSGSLVVDGDGRAVGLLTAAMTGHAMVNPILAVTEALGVTLSQADGGAPRPVS
jgi:hypothetical protein